MKAVEITTDGSCKNGGGKGHGPGGYAALLSYNDSILKIYGGRLDTTNQRMELTAAVKALATLKESCQVALYSDSAYLCNGITKHWPGKWQQNGWRNSQGKPVANQDLWLELDRLVRQHQVEARHIPRSENLQADELANLAAAKLLSTQEEFDSIYSEES